MSTEVNSEKEKSVELTASSRLPPAVNGKKKLEMIQGFRASLI